MAAAREGSTPCTVKLGGAATHGAASITVIKDQEIRFRSIHRRQIDIFALPPLKGSQGIPRTDHRADFSCAVFRENPRRHGGGGEIAAHHVRIGAARHAQAAGSAPHDSIL
jgi:hypothetical protein